MTRKRSLLLYEEACQSLVGGVNSNARAFKKVQLPPLIAKAASCDLLYDADDRKYIDYCNSWGALILGHGHPDVVAAACGQTVRGASFGLTFEGEGQLSSQIIKAIPSIEKIRFTTSGTEACMTAIRLAREITKRPNIVVFEGNYHGHAETLLPKAQGLLLLPFNDLSRLRAFFASKEARSVAAVIVEPIPSNMGLVHPVQGFLEALYEETRRSSSLLIFDEVVTGFRLGLSGAQGLYGIDPDLTCLGKIIGGGFPLAALGGKALFMDQLTPLGPVFHAGTMAGHPVGIAAGLATFAHLHSPDFYPKLHQKALRLTQPIQETLQKAKKPACLQQAGSLFTLFFGSSSVIDCHSPLDDALFAEFFQTLLVQGIFIPPTPRDVWNISSAHTEEHLDITAEAVCRFIRTAF